MNCKDCRNWETEEAEGYAPLHKCRVPVENSSDGTYFNHTPAVWENRIQAKFACGHNFKFFGSTFCSKKCYEDYFIPKLT